MLPSATIIYQTIEDRDNPDHIEYHGPFCCDRKNAWMGIGYYFWDSHIELAHWWGTVSYLNKQKQYVICKATCLIDEKCFDLHGVGQLRLEFQEVISELCRKLEKTEEQILFFQVIEYFKTKPSFVEKYESIRVHTSYSIRWKGTDKTGNYSIYFENGIQGFYDKYPPVQICLFRKKAHNLCNYKIVFPEDYIEEWV